MKESCSQFNTWLETIEHCLFFVPLLYPFLFPFVTPSRHYLFVHFMHISFFYLKTIEENKQKEWKENIKYNNNWKCSGVKDLASLSLTFICYSIPCLSFLYFQFSFQLFSVFSVTLCFLIEFYIFYSSFFLFLVKSLISLAFGEIRAASIL